MLLVARQTKKFTSVKLGKAEEKKKKKETVTKKTIESSFLAEHKKAKAGHKLFFSEPLVFFDKKKTKKIKKYLAVNFDEETKTLTTEKILDKLTVKKPRKGDIRIYTKFSTEEQRPSQIFTLAEFRVYLDKQRQ